MSSGASHYRDAETLMQAAGEVLLKTSGVLTEEEDPKEVMVFLLGAVVTLVAALDHAVLANAAATAGTLGDFPTMPEEWEEVLKDAQADPPATA